MTNQLVLFLFALPLVSGLLLLRVMRSDRRRQFARQRLTALTIDDHGSTPLPSLVRAPRGVSPLQLPGKLSTGLNSVFERAGDNIGLFHLMAAAIFAAIITILFTSNLLGLNPVIVSLSGAGAAMIAPVLVFLIAQSSYRNQFLNVFPDALDLIGRAVKAGLPVNEALAVVGRETANPVGNEFRRAIDQAQIGVPMIDALHETADRIRIPDFRFLVVALTLQSKTGGSLAETLSNFSGVIRARKAIRLKSRALSAEAKALAAVLAALPFVVTGAMYLLVRTWSLCCLAVRVVASWSASHF